MTTNLYYNTVSDSLMVILKKVMAAKEFEAFRLVGGTALSLQRGHRQSRDIDLFSDAKYGTLDFEIIYTFFCNNFPYVDTNKYGLIGMGKSYYVGQNKDNCIKLDIFYTDKFINDILEIDHIRLAGIKEIISMKVDVISRGGRKKDFWDIHELMESYTFEEMLTFHKKRYPFTHDQELLKSRFTDFAAADEDFEPICLRGKHWEIIKLDIIDFVKTISLK
jgi:hypothetical protein